MGWVKDARKVTSLCHDDYTSRKQISRIKTARVLQSEKSFVVDVSDVESDLIEVATDQDRSFLLATFLPFCGDEADQIADRVLFNLVPPAIRMFTNEVAHALFSTRYTGRFG